MAPETRRMVYPRESDSETSSSEEEEEEEEEENNLSESEEVEDRNKKNGGKFDLDEGKKKGKVPITIRLKKVCKVRAVHQSVVFTVLFYLIIYICTDIYILISIYHSCF